MWSFHLLWISLRTLLARRVDLAMENLALRQQLTILSRKTARPSLRNRDRFFWVVISKLWPHWRSIGGDSDKDFDKDWVASKLVVGVNLLHRRVL